MIALIQVSNGLSNLDRTDQQPWDCPTPIMTLRSPRCNQAFMFVSYSLGPIIE